MTLDADVLVDRRRTRRKLVFWRAAAFVLAALALIAGFAALGYEDGITPVRSHIARVTVSGVITEDKDLTDMIADLADEDAVKGIIVAVDSPGGTTTGGEALYDALRKAAAKKPMVATVGGLAASAGYMTAIAADHIVAQRTSITGSIGVYFQYGSVVPLLDKIGVSVDAIKSAPLKAEPSPFTREPVPGAREMIARLVDDTYQWFVDIVAERRNLPRDRALQLADGSIYSGRQALQLKLVDEIGTEDQAVAWLEKERGVEKDLTVIDRKPKSSGGTFGFGASAAAVLGSLIGVKLDLGQPALDGLVSVWHPQLSDIQ